MATQYLWIMPRINIAAAPPILDMTKAPVDADGGAAVNTGHGSVGDMVGSGGGTQ